MVLPQAVLKSGLDVVTLPWISLKRWNASHGNTAQRPFRLGDYTLTCAWFSMRVLRKLNPSLRHLIPSERNSTARWKKSPWLRTLCGQPSRRVKFLYRRWHKYLKPAFISPSAEKCSNTYLFLTLMPPGGKILSMFLSPLPEKPV